MLKFFRRIRQNLLSDGKTGKYFKYAIGEIILVVVGILIALQINNWNDQRIEQKFETAILKEILSNLDYDLVNIEKQMKWNEIYGKHNEIIYDHLKNKTPLTDTLKYSYSYLYGYGDFLPMTVAYENLKTEGIYIIKNQDLRNEISRLYDHKYSEVTTNLLHLIGYNQERHSNEIHEHLITEKHYVSAQPVDLEALQNDIQFQETLKSVAMTRRYSNGLYRDAKEDIIEVMMFIKNELAERN